jgi:hypothetical protein
MAESDEPRLTKSVAEQISSLGFSAADTERMHKLAAKAHEGTLTDKEQAEAETYSRIGSLLGSLKSKARRSLKDHSPDGHSNADGPCP